MEGVVSGVKICVLCSAPTFSVLPIYRHVRRNELQIIRTSYNIIPSIWCYTCFSIQYQQLRKIKTLKISPIRYP